MNFKEIKNKSEAELGKILDETRNKLRELRFKDANKQLKTVTEIREAKKTIARILTHGNSGKSALADKNQ